MKNVRKPLLTRLSRAALCLCLSLALPVGALAQAVTPSPTPAPGGLDDFFQRQLESQQEEIERLQRQLNELQNRPQVTATPRVYAPKVKLLSPFSVSLGKGETVDVELTVKNIGTSAAQNVLTQADPPDGPLSVAFLDNANSAGSISENASHTMTLRITADENAKAGNYPVKLNHAYRTQERKNETESDVLTVRVTGADAAPNVVLAAFRADRAAQVPGGTFTLTAPIQNLGDGTARNVRIALDLGENAKTIRPVSDLNNAQFNAMAAGYTGTLQFSFEIDEKARNGAYPITFNLTYRDEGDEKFEDSFTYYLNLASEETRSAVEIREMTAPAGLVAVDKSGLFSFQVFNAGEAALQHIEVEAAEYDDTAIVPTSDSKQILNVVTAGSGRLVNFAFMPTANAESRSYTVCFIVRYESGYDEDGKPTKHEVKQYASLHVTNPDKTGGKDAERIAKPRMMISQYAADPVIVSAGREFDLHITFQNASPDKAVDNIKIKMEAVETTEKRGAVFAPVNGSNTYYIDHIEPKGEVRQTLRMYTVPDADPRTYKLEVIFDYQDEDFNEFQETEQIGISVKQTTRLEIDSAPYIPEMAGVGERVNFWFSIINSGQVTLGNVRVKLEGDFDVSEAERFIGNVGKGNQASYEGAFVPVTPGKQKGSIVVTGEDATGELVESRHDFTIEVMDMGGGMGFEGMDGMDGAVGVFPRGDGVDMGGMVIDGGEFGYLGGGAEGAGAVMGLAAKATDFMKKPYFWGPLAGLFVAGGVAAFFIGRRYRNKKAAYFE